MVITTENVLAYALQRGLIGRTESARVEELSGGVSCNVVRVHASRRALVIKQALPQLRVKDIWLSDPQRIFREVAFQRLACKALGSDRVPTVLDEDRDNFAYTMASAPLDAENWKGLMLRGRIEPELGRVCGEMLRTIQQIQPADPCVPPTFADKTFFRQLRLEPYLEFTALKHPDVAPRLLQLRDELEGAHECLCHADYTPKNFLVSGRGMMLLDHEVIHIGSPVFDIASIINHLTLKAIHLPQHQDALRQTARAFLAAVAPRCDWIPCFGALLLARCDGKSPAEYLTETDKEVARTLAKNILRGHDEDCRHHWS